MLPGFPSLPGVPSLDCFLGRNTCYSGTARCRYLNWLTDFYSLSGVVRCLKSMLLLFAAWYSFHLLLLPGVSLSFGSWKPSLIAEFPCGFWWPPVKLLLQTNLSLCQPSHAISAPLSFHYNILYPTAHSHVPACLVWPGDSLSSDHTSSISLDIFIQLPHTQPPAYSILGCLESVPSLPILLVLH